MTGKSGFAHNFCHAEMRVRQKFLGKRYLLIDDEL